jgi:hypothetical protein
MNNPARFRPLLSDSYVPGPQLPQVGDRTVCHQLQKLGGTNVTTWLSPGRLWRCISEKLKPGSLQAEVRGIRERMGYLGDIPDTRRGAGGGNEGQLSELQCDL